MQAFDIPATPSESPPAAGRWGGKTLRLALAFVLLTVALLTVAEALVAWRLPSAEARKFAAITDPRTPIDGLILGTSHGAEGLDPGPLNEHGGQWYNFAFHGAGPRYFERWYRLYRAHRPAPRQILVLADWFMFKPTMWRRIEHDSALMPFADFVGLLGEPGLARSALWMNRSVLLRNRRDVQMAILGDRAFGHLVMERFNRGYAPFVYGPASRLQPPYQHDDEPASQAAFEALLATWRAEGVGLCFVQTPEFLPEAGSHPVENRRLAALAKGAGAAFLNYNDERRSSLNQERRWFNDWGHLNEAGAHRFSIRLAEDLARLGILERR